MKLHKKCGLLIPALASALAFALGSAALLFAPQARAQEQEKEKGKRERKTKVETPGPGGLVADKGKFRVLLDGQPVGTEEFYIAPSGNEWVARSNVEINIPTGEAAKVRAELKLAPNGTPQHYEWTAQGQKKNSATIIFQGGMARAELRMEGASPFTQEFTFDSPNVVVLDNNVYHHYAILARMYDWKTKGAQTFPVLIPQEMTPGTITVESAGQQEIAGVKYELLKVRSADLEIDLYLDASWRLVRLSVPASKAEVMREQAQ